MRSPSGSVTVEIDKGRLRIRLPRFVFGGRLVWLSLKLPNTPINRQAAEIKARQIELDIAIGQFDPTLDKYRTPTAVTLILLIDLWDKYALEKSKTLSATTIAKDYKKTRNHLEKLPTQRLERARAIKEYLIKNLTSDAARRCLVQINACCKWAIEAGLITNNPFERISLPKKAIKRDIDPFSQGEVAKILEGFSGQYYLPFIKFLFSTGCRPSEAVALTWQDISPDFSEIVFSEAIVEGNRKDTKTHKIRKFPCNQSLISLLTQLERKNNLVFPAPEGGLIDNHNLLTRQWKPILEAQNIRHRPLYNTRHTFITHCLESNIPVTQIAKWVGNSPKTIWSHYAGLVSRSTVPEMYEQI